MVKTALVSLSLWFFLTACFGAAPKEGSVTAYYNGVVRTQGGSFRIGELPGHWRREKIKLNALVFVNGLDRSTITIDSWCRRAVDDAPIADLTKQLYVGLEDLKITSQRPITLSGRTGLKTLGDGVIDGKRVVMAAVVMKMHTCVFDFVYVSLPGEMAYYEDFNAMVRGFEYVMGPPVL